MTKRLSTAIAVIVFVLIAAVAIAATERGTERPERSVATRLVPATAPADLNPCSAGACW